MMQEKAARKAAEKEAKLASGGTSAAEVAEIERKKAAQREAKKERAYASTQVAKQNAKNLEHVPKVGSKR